MSAFDQAVHTIQFLSADAVQKANSGHPGTPMALAGITVDVFTRHLRYDPRDPQWPNRDRFVLSAGHASMLLYSTLHLAGYDVSLDDLKDFRQWGSKTPGHPEYGHTPGVETTTGPLGQGIGNAVGMALASKMHSARVDGDSATPLIDYRVFVLAGDGDMMEGVSAEAASLAGHLGLGNLVVVYDANKITIDGSTDKSFTEDVGARFAAFGWAVSHVDGHAPEQVRAALDEAVAETGKPSLIVARTHIGIGTPTKQDSAAAHGAPLGDSEIDGAKKKAGWPEGETFRVPEQAFELFRARAEENGKLRADWQARVGALTGEAKTAFDVSFGGAPTPELLPLLLEGLEPVVDATRSIAAKLQQQVAAHVPMLVGGSADLAGSCKTTIKGAADIAAGSFAGRNFNFGVREHGMGAVMNGLAVSGFVPFGSTFLIFSDYMRPAIRLAGLMGQRAVYVFTHDTVFVGEDGPTHQPIEQLWSLRLIPNVHVFRPADAFECAAAWAHAIEREDGPTALVLSRQKLPALPRKPSIDELRAGAYVLEDATDADATLIASGSEVGTALAAAALLREGGKAIRVVSAPCLELFLEQPRAEQDRVLGTGLRVSIEAGRSQPWGGIVGRDGLSIGIDRFGASAPAERIAEELGFTPASVAEKVRARLG